MHFYDIFKKMLSFFRESQEVDLIINYIRNDWLVIKT